MIHLKKLTRWMLYAVTLLLIVFVLAVLAVRFIIFPNIDAYKEEIAAHASKSLGQKITIGNILTSWDGISPHVGLKNIELFDAENRVALHLNNVEANISWLSLPLLQPRLAKLVVHQPDLTIRRQTDGSIYLAGINLAGESKPEFPNWLLSQAEVIIKNAQVTWLDDLRQAPPLSLKQLNLTLSNPTWKSLFGEHQFELSALPSIGTSQLIEANGRFVGSDVSKLKAWHGELFLQLKQADLAVWQPWLDYKILNRPIDLQTGTGDAEVWLDFADATIEKVKVRSALNNVSVIINKQTAPFVAKQLSGDIGWSDFKNTQTISAQNIKLNSNTGLNINKGSGYYSTSTRNGKPWVKADLKLDQFNLATIKELSPYLSLPQNLIEQLNGFALVGELQALALGYEGEASKASTYKISSTFKKLGLNAYLKNPGFSNLSGSIVADDDGGKVILNSQNAVLNFKDILRWPIPADKLSGQINWQMNGDKAKIKAKELFIANPHITGTLNASYDMNHVKGGYLDLVGKFGKGNAKYALFYYPISLGKVTLNWLDTSILAGGVEDVNLAVKGNLADFPYVNNKNQLDKKLGVFKVTAKLSDTLLEYGTGWPVIEGLGLDLLFEGKRMELNAYKGRIFGNKIIKSKTEIANLDADNPMLHIISDLEGPVAEGIKFVNESPVKLVTQGFTDSLKTAGQGKLNLELKIPMQNLEASKYKGVYKISNGTIFANTEVGLPELSKLNGVLNFTENSLTTQNVATEILGGPAQFSLRTGSDKVLYVAAKGRISDVGIKKLASNALIDAMQGSADWAGEITIKKPMVDVNLRSNLIGMAIALPAPFNKPANQDMPFSFEKKQTTPSNDNMDIKYGNLASAKILRNEQAGKLVLERGDIGINMAAVAPSQPGLSLHGKLDYLDADDWLALFSKPNSKTDAAPIAINKADINIQKLDVFGRRLNALKVIAQPNATGLQMAIESKEITGNAEWQSAGSANSGGKIIARLKNLTVPNSSEASSETRVAANKDFRKMSKSYPALDVVAENFQLGNKNLGNLELNAFETGEDWNIQKLKITNPDSSLLADGRWHNWTRNPNTKLSFTLDIDNIGKTLKRFGQPDTVKGGEATIAGQLEWSGSPHQFETDGLNGYFKLEANKGQILKVKPGVGRLFGLLTLQSLPRRLSLDFKDLFSDGFAFDKISANAKIDNGILRSDDFFMTGPAAETSIKGETNLKTETQKLNVTVTPHISDSLSLAALAGGPIAGAAAFVAQKILKDPFNKIISSEYTIIGTWDKPVEIESEKDGAHKPSSKSPLSPNL